MKTALLVGIDTYKSNEIPASFGCRNSSYKWENLLSKIFNFDKIILLNDENASTENIKSNFSSSLESLQQNDVFFYFHASHGVNKDKTKETLEAIGDKKDEVLLTFDGKIQDDEIRSMLNKNTQNARVVMMIEACKNGTIEENTESILISKQANEIIFTASTPSEDAEIFSFNGFKMGVFSYYMTKVLSKNPLLNYIELFRKVEFEIKNSTFKRFNQNIQLIFTDVNFLSENCFSGYKVDENNNGNNENYIIKNKNIRQQSFFRHNINGEILFKEFKTENDYIEFFAEQKNITRLIKNNSLIMNKTILHLNINN